MKVDIKSLLIGVLTIINIFLLMGFEHNNKEEKEFGRYQFVEIYLEENPVLQGQAFLWVDTSNGDIVASMGQTELAREVMNELTFLEDLEEKLMNSQETE